MSNYHDSVHNWLQNLRYSIENYDSYERDASTQDINRGVPSSDRKMSSESENLKRISAYSGSYENVWSCDTELKYGHVCRISFEFDETVDDLCLSPVVLTQFDFDIPTNILQWKMELLYDCSSEDEESQEYASLEKINEEKGQSCLNQVRPFPIETTVEIRHNDPIIRTNHRSQTLHEYAFGNLQQQLEETYVDVQIDIKGVVKMYYDGTTRKLNKNQSLRIFNDQLNLVTDKGEEEPIIDCLSQTRYKPVSKKEVTIASTTPDVCKVYKLQFDSTKDMNVAIIDLEQYYGKDRSSYVGKLQSTSGEEKLQIRHRLLKLLGKRSSKDFLEKRGIIKNEPIFGNTLRHLHDMYKLEVPEFVLRILHIIELANNITSVGLYRASGNLAMIQKIRFHIDKNNLKILEEFKNDIDVLTGSLKLFFRELKEPLIPHKVYEEMCKYIDTELTPKVEEHIKHLVNKMEKPHRKTLLTLLDHLNKVESHSAENRMDAYNISIVWGPTLIWPPDNCHENILLNHTNASKVVELLLNIYKKVLKVLPRNESSPKVSHKEVNEEDAAKHKNALMLELNENLHHNLKKTTSKDSLARSTEGLTKSTKSPSDKDVRFDLDNLCANSKEKIPEFVLRTVPLIEKSINSELLYKRSGSNEKLEKIKKKLNKNQNNLNSMDKYNTHDLTSALKYFFSEIKTPLIPKEVLDRLATAVDERNEIVKLRTVKKEFLNSDIPNRETLDYLLRHLVNVSQHEEQNKMSKHNLATEWGPILCRFFIDTREIIVEVCVQVIETLLQIYDNRTAINLETERTYTNIYHSENRSDEVHYLGRSPDKSPVQVLPAVFKRKPKIIKNDSSLYRVSRYITNTFSMYDNVQYDDIKDEATILEIPDKKNLEDRTKL